MLTKPTAIVQRTVDPNIVNNLNNFSNVIEEIVNYGSTIILAPSEAVTNGEENIPPIMLFRHYLDIIDSLSILVRAGICDTSKILIRSAFETKLQLEYIFENHTYDRSLAYTVSNVVNKINLVRKTLPTTDVGKSFYKMLDNEGYFKELTISPKDILEAEDYLESKLKMLNSPVYKDVYSEYLTSNKKYPKWFSLYGGPKTIKLLAEYLKQASSYDLLYGDWSDSVHASDVYMNKISPSEIEGMSNFIQLRFPLGVQEIVRNVISMSVILYRKFIKNRVPEKLNEFTEWHDAMKPTFLQIFEGDFIIMEKQTSS